MRVQVRDRLADAYRRVRRIRRRELRDFRRWLENTRNLLHLSVLVLLPLVLALVTALSNAVSELPFLLFPPLASGTYTLFAQPESRYASPRRFVGGLTAGAVSGWLALELVARLWFPAETQPMTVSPLGVAVSIFLTGGVTWALDVEEASAFSAALLVHVTGFTTTSPTAYVVSIFASSTIVATVFVVWRRQFYEQRADFLYQSTQGDDHVLVPMRTDDAGATAMLGARLAAAHEAGKVVLVDLVDDEAVAAAERDHLSRPAGDVAGVGGGAGSMARESTAPDEPAGSPPEGGSLTAADIEEMATDRSASAAATRLEERARQIETQVGVPCEVVVAVDQGTPARTVVQTAHETNCDLIATPYEQRHGSLSPFVRGLFRGDVDVLVHRSDRGATRWRRVMVPVRRAGDVAHAMIDFALRLTGRSGHVSVCNCVGTDGDRRRAEDLLANLVEPFEGAIETRVARSDIEPFLADNARSYDLVFMGASRDRSAASRLVSPPTFERIRDLDCDVAIVDRNYR